MLLALLACTAAGHRPPVATAPSPDEEAQRLALVRKELAQGRPTEVPFDTAGLRPEERQMLSHLVDAAQGIEALFLLQRGALELRDQVSDPDSAALFFRNLGPWCEGGDTRDEAACSALASRPPRVSGLYPAALQSDGFCERLEAEHAELLSPFTALVEQDGGLVAVPYSRRWPEQMAAVAEHLRLAAAAIAPLEDEAALRAYLEATARAFGDDDWWAADAAWAEMNQANSRWYLRVGPDETPSDPCGRHAAFHMSLARVSAAGLVWQQRLEPVKQDMEAAFAALAGPSYAARPVGFDLPEFIEVVLNAGDSRSPVGATVGQSLPNWGPVADAGGRTVAMSNLGTDPESLRVEGEVMASLLCPATLPLWPADPGPQLGSTVLHEAAHNLGPVASHRVDGRSDEQAFGGPGALLAEELKSQTASLWFPAWLADRGLLEAEAVLPMAMGDIGWALNQVASGMTEGDGSPNSYARLSAIQLGWLNVEGALRWEAGATAANGQDVGCFEVDSARLPAAIDSLAAEVLRVEGEMDRAGLEALDARFAEGDPMGAWAEVTRRTARHPRPSYVYVIDGEAFSWAP